MNGFSCLNLLELKRLFKKLTPIEFDFLVFMLSYLSCKSKSLYINNEETREYLASIGYNKTAVRISTVLSSLTKKGVLKREAQGVFSIIGDLYRPAEEKPLQSALNSII